MTVTVKLEGFRELDQSLAQFSKAVTRNILLRALAKAAAPIVAMASALAPRDKGELGDSVQASSKSVYKTGAAEFAAVLRGGGSKGDALSALRDARRAANGAGFFVEMFAGPTKATNKKDAIKRIVQEFGSRFQPGKAYMRPAWDAKKYEALGLIKGELTVEIEKAARRAASRQAKGR
jgi:HK97 gp10 family phage protein